MIDLNRVEHLVTQPLKRNVISIFEKNKRTARGIQSGYLRYPDGPVFTCFRITYVKALFLLLIICFKNRFSNYELMSK